MKRRIRLTESDLHRIVRESVERVINEAYSDSQYAHLAGQASGALNSFGGRLRGIFDPKWKNRKKRQMQKFANQATGDNLYSYSKSSTNGGENNLGRSSLTLPNHDITYSKGGTADYISNSFNGTGKGDNPFQYKRTNYYSRGSEAPSDSRYTNLSHNGETYNTRHEFDDAYNAANPFGKKTSDAYFDTTGGHSDLNKAFRQGRNARKGNTIKFSGGNSFQNGTGTRSEYFKHLK